MAYIILILFWGLNSIIKTLQYLDNVRTTASNVTNVAKSLPPAATANFVGKWGRRHFLREKWLPMWSNLSTHIIRSQVEKCGSWLVLGFILWHLNRQASKLYKVHFRASILARLSYQKSLKKLDWRVISKKNLLVRLTGASMRAICCVMSSTFHLKAFITDK